MATTTVNALPDTEFTSSDSVWATARSATASDSIDASGTTMLIGATSTLGYSIYRVGLKFDTSAIPSDAILVSAQINLYPDSHTATHTVNVVSYTPTADPWTTDQFDEFGTTSLGSRVFYTGNTGASFAIGVDTAAITKAGTTHLGLIGENDRANSAPTGDYYGTFRTVDYGGGSTFWPRLSVNWTPATQTHTPSLVGGTSGIHSPTLAESVTATPSLVGGTSGTFTATLQNAGGIMSPDFNGVSSGTFAANFSVGGTAIIGNSALIGTGGGVFGSSTGTRPRLIGPFYALVYGTLSEGSYSTLSALLRRSGDEPIPLTNAVSVDVKVTDQDGATALNWTSCTIVSAADAEVTVNVSDTALAGVLTADVVWRITWDGGVTYVPTATHTMGVFS